MDGELEVQSTMDKKNHPKKNERLILKESINIFSITKLFHARSHKRDRHLQLAVHNKNL